MFKFRSSLFSLLSMINVSYYQILKVFNFRISPSGIMCVPPGCSREIPWLLVHRQVKDECILVSKSLPFHSTQSGMKFDDFLKYGIFYFVCISNFYRSIFFLFITKLIIAFEDVLHIAWLASGVNRSVMSLWSACFRHFLLFQSSEGMCDGVMQ